MNNITIKYSNNSHTPKGYTPKYRFGVIAETSVG